jgi:epoxide hydrolase-like predicted phosphatase
MPIKALVFDCGGVVLRDGDESYYARWEQRLGMPEGNLKRTLYAGPLWSQAESGQITETVFWRSAGEDLGLSRAQASALASDAWASWSVDPVVLSLVQRARGRFRVGMLSNATDALETKLRHNYGIADLFDPIINSSRVGVAKPDPAIYQELLKRMHLEPGEIVFIDDRADNIAAAAAMGMHVIWFVSPEELERHLSPYLSAQLLPVDQPDSSR